MKTTNMGNLEITINVKELKLWDKGNKKRYYFDEEFVRGSGLFFSEKEDNARYFWKVENGFVYANKVYGGSVEQALKNLER